MVGLGVVSVGVDPRGEAEVREAALRRPGEAAQLFTNQYGSSSIC